MKTTKTLGLAALAVLMAMALVGASSAMAENTQLCSADEATCAGGNLVTHVHEETLTGAKAKFLMGRTGTVECDVLLSGDTLGLGNPLTIHGNFTYTNCRLGGTNCMVNEVSSSALVGVLRLGHESANVTIEWEVGITCGVIIKNCVYDGVGMLGTATGPLLSSFLNGDVTLTEQTLNKVSGLCASTGRLDISMMPLTAVYLSE